MTDPAILFVKPGTIKGDDKDRLAAAGVVVVEVDDPQSVKLVRAHAELPQSALLEAAALAINEPGVGRSSLSEVRVAFAENVCKAIVEQRKNAR